MQTRKEKRHRWRQLVCLRKGRRPDVREGENAWKRGEGGDLMLTWWALESSCGCKGLRGADGEFRDPSVRQCMEALACKEKLCRLCRKLSPRNFKKGLYWLMRIS